MMHFSQALQRPVSWKTAWKVLWKEVKDQLHFLRLSQIFLVLFLLSFPFQIRTLVYSGSLYYSGNFSPYTTFFLYASDLLLVLSFLLWGIAVWKGETSEKIHFGYQGITFFLLLFSAMLLGNLFLAGDKVLHLFTTFRFLELFLLYFLMVNRIVSLRMMMGCFLAACAFQALVAFFQYFSQGSLGLRILGEPVATPSTLGVAKIDIFGGKVLRAFGTFPHANILGGALLMATVFSFAFPKKYLWFFAPLAIFFAAALLISFSRSAFFGLVISFMVFLSLQEKKISFRWIALILSLLLFFVVAFKAEEIFFRRFLFEDFQSTQERTTYFDISKNMLLAHPFGVGLGGFTLGMQDFTAVKLAPWLFQPVHNVFFLVMNETGIQGIIFFALMLAVVFYALLRYFSRVKFPNERQMTAILLALFFGIMTIFLFDHYFFSLYPGQVMLFFYFGLVSSFLRNERFPMRKV